MEKSLVPIDPALLALMHGSFGKDGGLMPFVREIMLVECHIAGTSHRTLKDIEPTLAPGALLVLKREMSNPHDPLAIMIFAGTGFAPDNVVSGPDGLTKDFRSVFGDDDLGLGNLHGAPGGGNPPPFSSSTTALSKPKAFRNPAQCASGA
jgi:hypothetical protein